MSDSTTAAILSDRVYADLDVDGYPFGPNDRYVVQATSIVLKV